MSISRKINYPVGDFLIRLKNAVIARNKVVKSPATKVVKSVAEILKSEGFLETLTVDGGVMTATLSIKRKEPVLMDVKLVSKPGLRIYMKLDELRKQVGPFVLILSTPLGILTGKNAIKKKTGGEVIAKIY